MPHSAGWTLATAIIQFINDSTTEFQENVFYFDLGATAANQSNADSIATLLQTYWSVNYPPNLSMTYKFHAATVILDDGVNQFGSYLSAANTQGSATGADLPQVMCAIIRKRAVGRGRKRFGHTCAPGITANMLATENTLATAYIDSLTAFYAGVVDASTLTGQAGAKLVLYNPTTDARQVVFEMVCAEYLKTQRRRTPGRGM